MNEEKEVQYMSGIVRDEWGEGGRGVVEGEMNEEKEVEEW
jgi:hypothetical protein